MNKQKKQAKWAEDGLGHYGSVWEDVTHCEISFDISTKAPFSLNMGEDCPFDGFTVMYYKGMELMNISLSMKEIEDMNHVLNCARWIRDNVAIKFEVFGLDYTLWNGQKLSNDGERWEGDFDAKFI